MDTFLPQGYEAPKDESNFMKIEKDSDNRFRVLSPAIVGYEYWNNEDKPVRVKNKPDNMPADIRIEDDGAPSKIKHFWAFVVWNYESEKVQVLEITQKGIMKDMVALAQDVDWGHPRGYDIKITRTGEKLQTRYSVSPKPHTPLTDEIKALYEETDIDLEALFRGENPFKD